MRLQLILFRHAEAVDVAGGGNDHARTLTPRGENQAVSTGEQLAAGGYVPALAIVSDAQRTLGTWQQAKASFKTSVEVVHSREVYTTNVAGLAKLLSSVETRFSSVILVGHNPHISGLASDLAGEDLRFHKGDAVVFTIKADSWAEAMAAMGDWEITVQVHPAAAR